MQYSRRVKRAIELSKEICKDSDMCCRMGATLISGKTVIASRSNNSNRSKLNNLYTPSMHAELNVLYNFYNTAVKRKDSHKNVDIFVVRLTKDNEIGTSHPCNMCIKFMQSIKDTVRIRWIYYFDSNRLLRREKLDEIKTIHESNIVRILKKKNILTNN